jgi:hypothetical protein
VIPDDCSFSPNTPLKEGFACLFREHKTLSTNATKDWRWSIGLEKKRVPFFLSDPVEGREGAPFPPLPSPKGEGGRGSTPLKGGRGCFAREAFVFSKLIFFWRVAGPFFLKACRPYPLKGVRDGGQKKGRELIKLALTFAIFDGTTVTKSPGFSSKLETVTRWPFTLKNPFLIHCRAPATVWKKQIR